MYTASLYKTPTYNLTILNAVIKMNDLISKMVEYISHRVVEYTFY